MRTKKCHYISPSGEFLYTEERLYLFGWLIYTFRYKTV